MSIAYTETLPFFWKPSARHTVVPGRSYRQVAPPGSLYQGIPGKESLQTSLVGDGALSPQECAEVIVLAKRRRLRDGRMVGGIGEQRRCQVAWLEETADSAWLFERLRCF